MFPNELWDIIVGVLAQQLPSYQYQRITRDTLLFSLSPTNELCTKDLIDIIGLLYHRANVALQIASFSKMTTVGDLFDICCEQLILNDKITPNFREVVTDMIAVLSAMGGVYCWSQSPLS